MFEFMVSSLATWRIAHMLVEEDGPWDIVSKFRSVIGVKYYALCSALVRVVRQRMGGSDCGVV